MESGPLSIAESHVLILKGNNFVQLGNLSEALCCFQEAAECNPNNASAWYNLGLCLVKIGQYYDLALGCFERTIELEPNDGEAWNNKGTILEINGKVLDALNCYQRATEISRNSNAWYNMALLYKKSGNEKAAKDCLKRGK